MSTSYVLGGHDLIEFFQQPHALDTSVPIFQRCKLRHRKIAGPESRAAHEMVEPRLAPLMSCVHLWSL